MSINREELAPGLVVEWYDPEPLAWHRRLRLRVVFVVSRIVRVPIAIRDEFWETALDRVVAAPAEERSPAVIHGRE